MTIRLHTPEQGAEILQGTASWLKEKARRREIPFTMIGGAYRWTDAHLEEIAQMFEQRPQQKPAAAFRRPSAQRPDGGAQLTARRPRRARNTTPETSEAGPASPATATTKDNTDVHSQSNAAPSALRAVPTG